MKMLKAQIIITIGFILTLAAYGAAQFDMSPWFSSSEYENSLEIIVNSEEDYGSLEKMPKRKGRNANEQLTTTFSPKSVYSVGCDLEQLQPPNYKAIDRIRYDTYHCLKCRSIELLSKQKLEIHGKPNLKYIMFEKSRITIIPEEVFSSFTNFTLLYRLYLNNSFVNSIESRAFIGLSVLEELYLQNNNISELLKSGFSYLPHVKLLNLSYNNISYIQESAFADLLSLRILFLNNNNIKILLEHTFNNLKYLTLIDLSNNQLLDISHLLFYTLGHLDLRCNNLTAVDFSRLPVYLEQISLDNNQINYIENLKKIENVVYLSLSNNNITNVGDYLPTDVKHANFSRNNVHELSTSIFNGASYLTIIDFSYNLIERLDQDHFKQTGGLIEIYFQNNKLTAVPDGCFRNLYLLKLLNLSSNYITDFKFGTFSGLHSLEFLDISNNKAASIYGNSFYALVNLKVLNIGGNFLSSLDSNALINNIRKLSVVTLDNNPWICKYLTTTVNALQKAQINVTKGSVVTGQNVHGIACSDRIQYVTTTMVPSIQNNISSNADLKKLQAISNELKIMRDFFNQDFINTSFYKYFETFKNIKATENFDSKYISNVLVNHIDESFKNTTFYKYLSNSESLKSLSNISKALRYLNINFENVEPSKYVNRHNNEDILLKVSELQTGITTVMIIVIVMLLSIVILFILQKFSRPVNLINKSVFRKRSSSSEIELI